MPSNPRRCPPPKGFVHAMNVTFARACGRPHSIPIPHAGKGARGDGIRYERKGHDYVEGVFPDRYKPSPWFDYTNGAKGSHYCQPDGLVLQPRRGTILICEFKLKHTSVAWWQLRRLYEPVVRKVFGPIWKYRVVEIVKWFDPHTAFPERFELVDSLHDIRDSKFYVHVWTGRL